MGNAQVAAADDVYTLYWNPAHLGFLEYQEMGATRLFLPEGASMDFLGYIYPDRYLGGMGLGVELLQTGGIDGRDAHDLPTASLDYQHYRATLAYGRAVFPFLSAGLSLNYEGQRLAGYAGSGMGLEMALLYRYQSWLQIGLDVKNILPVNIKLYRTSSAQPLQIRLGGSAEYGWDPQGKHLVSLAADLEQSLTLPLFLHVGMEYCYDRFLSVRAGWDTDHFTGGLGVGWKSWSLDYGLSYQSVFGLSHLLSLQYRFGKSAEERETLRKKIERTRLFKEITVRQNNLLLALGAEAMNAMDWANAEQDFRKALGWKEDDKTREAWQEAKQQLDRQRAGRFLESAKALEKEGRLLEALGEVIHARRTFSESAEANILFNNLRQVLTREIQTLGGSQALLKLGLDGLEVYAQGLWGEAREIWGKASGDQTGSKIGRWAAVAEQNFIREALFSPAAALPKEQLEAAGRLEVEGITAYNRLDLEAAEAAWQQAIAINAGLTVSKDGLERIRILLKRIPREKHHAQ
jgi:hypothetical protein